MNGQENHQKMFRYISAFLIITFLIPWVNITVGSAATPNLSIWQSGSLQKEEPIPTTDPGDGAIPSTSDTLKAGSLTVTGRWTYYDRSGNLVGAWKMIVELVNGKTQAHLAWCYTDYDGYYSCGPVTNPGSAGVKTKLYTYTAFSDANKLIVVNPDLGNQANISYAHSFTQASLKILKDGTQTLGESNVGLSNANRQALWIQKDIIDGWMYIRNNSGNQLQSPGGTVVQWKPDSTDGNYYTPGENIHLAGSAALSINLTNYEFGKNIMYTLYGKTFPTPDCDSTHEINKVSQKTCAWIEGWAIFFSLIVNNDLVFRYSDGSTVNFDSPTWGTSGWENGDSVEGRVAGALWDMIDSNIDGTDSFSNLFSNYWNSLYNQNDNSLNEFIAAWLSRGYNRDETFQSILQNTIDFRQLPNPPYDVQASDGVYQDKVAIQWSAGEEDAYEIYRNTVNSSDGALLVDTSSIQSFEDTSAAGGQTYFYFVKACNGTVCSDFSSSDSGYKLSATVPTPLAPIGTIFTKTPTLQWIPVPGATKYWLQICNGECKTGTVIYENKPASSVCTSTVCKHVITTQLSLGTYQWHVRSYIGAGWKVYSGYAIFQIANGFNSQFISGASGWSPVAATWSIYDGGYYGTQGWAGMNSSIIHSTKYGTFTYTASIKRTSSDGTSANRLIIRGVKSPLSTNYKWYSGYVFEWTDDQHFQVYKTINGKDTILKYWTDYSGINSQDWNTIKITAKGSTLGFYINDSLVWTGTDSSLTTGQVGIGMFRRKTEANTTFLVDWATLSSIVATAPHEQVVHVGEEHPDWTSVDFAGPR